MIIAQNERDLITYKGDSCYITFNITDLKPETVYQVYMQFNFNTPLVFQSELESDEEGKASVSFFVKPEQTKVTPGAYTWGIKICIENDDVEDTSLHGKLTILKEIVEGTLNE